MAGWCARCPSTGYGWYMQPLGSKADLVSVESIEQELTLLVRRAQKVHLRGEASQVLCRSYTGYGSRLRVA